MADAQYESLNPAKGRLILQPKFTGFFKTCEMKMKSGSAKQHHALWIPQASWRTNEGDCWDAIVLLNGNFIESLKEFRSVFRIRKTKGEWVNPSRFKVLRLQMFLQRFIVI